MGIDLAGKRVLVVEDEYLLADDARGALLDIGAEVIGPVPTADEAQAVIDGGRAIDAALLDINLRGEMAYAIADALRARDIPFVFVTGYDAYALPARFAGAPLVQKPLRREHLETLSAILPRTRG